jgi:3-hydroxyacyl-[acyl-carrier-protein] dehydratase
MTAAPITLTIPADHPALPGHFPGNPVVPGAVILAEIAAALERRIPGTRVSGFVTAKFLAPLRPDRQATLIFHDKGPGHAAFDLNVGDVRIATGALRYTLR